MPAAPRPARPRRLGRARLRRLVGLVVALVVLAPAVASAVPLEDFSGYQPQTKCSPTAKSGTVALSQWLMDRYPGSGSLGISRACGHGGTSEHKEGRAFDWAVSATSKRDRGYVKDLFASLFAADAEGNPAALARRMGIMYLIWDDHIYASYRGFEKKAYLNSGCRSVKKCSVTLRHRNHVHISLSRPGGKGDTSWYHRDDPTWVSPIPETPVPATPVPPPPVDPTTPAPSPTTPVVPTPIPPAPTKHQVKLGKKTKGQLRLSRKKRWATVRVPSDGSTSKSRWKLRKGKTYKLTVGGVVSHGSPDQVSDAACAWSSQTRSWIGAPVLKVNGHRRFGTTCADGHVYAATFVPRTSGRLRVKLATPAAVGAGRLVLTVSKRRTDVAAAMPRFPTFAPPPALQASTRGTGLLAETLAVPAGASGPVSTVQEVAAGARYRLTVSGVVDLGDGVQSDGQCLGIDGAWYAAASLDPRRPDLDHGNLYVNAQPFAGEPTDCTTHTHVMEFTAGATRRLQLALWDPLGPAGNTGDLTVTVQRLSDLAEPAAGGTETARSDGPWAWGVDTLQVQLTSRTGTLSTMRVRRGERVTVDVSGTFTSHGLTADATCVATASGWSPRDPALALAQDPLELWVDGAPRPWTPSGASAGGCAAGHGYTTSYVATKSGPLALAVLDLDHRDNAGTLQVTITRS